MEGPNPMERVGKKYEQQIANKVRKDYHVERNTKGLIINPIDNLGLRMGTLLLACIMTHKCQAMNVPDYVIQLAEHCEKGVYFNKL